MKSSAWCESERHKWVLDHIAQRSDGAVSCSFYRCLKCELILQLHW